MPQSHLKTILTINFCGIGPMLTSPLRSPVLVTVVYRRGASGVKELPFEWSLKRQREVTNYRQEWES